MADVNLGEIILTEIKSINEKIGEVNVTLAKQEVNIDTHIKRTNILEDKIVPIEKFMGTVNAGLKLIGAGAVLVSLATGIIKLVEFIKH
jgi:hypothetical protein